MSRDIGVHAEGATYFSRSESDISLPEGIIAPLAPRGVFTLSLRFYCFFELTAA